MEPFWSTDLLAGDFRRHSLHDFHILHGTYDIFVSSASLSKVWHMSNFKVVRASLTIKFSLVLTNISLIISKIPKCCLNRVISNGPNSPVLTNRTDLLNYTLGGSVVIQSTGWLQILINNFLRVRLE